MANVPEHKKAELEELLHIHVKRHARGWNPVQLIEQHTLLCDAVLDERAEVARLRARVADSVPRAVAARGAVLFATATLVVATGPEDKDLMECADTIIAKCASALAKVPSDEGALALLRAALARAEAEAKAQP